jgi:glutamate decarboxylase
LVSLAGEWVTAVTNTNMFTYEIAPFYNLVEEVTLKKMRDYLGWEDGDGIFNPGGSISNLYAVQLAKYFHFPESKINGLFQMPKIIVFTSTHVNSLFHIKIILFFLF